ncbi:MAG: radical SAM protein [bacterium]|nr:radical SAM protein [bacterium]
MIKAKLLKDAEERIKDLNKLQKEGLICLDGQFFPSVHYPPINMYPPIDEKTLFKGYANPSGNLFDIYVHIPFCMKYCVFCHYPVKIGAPDEEKDHYLNMLEKEMDIYMNRLGLKTIKPRSILIGGGTPTYLIPARLEKFLRSFSSRVDLNSCTQFSYDVDPLTLLGKEGGERLKILKSFGVDRLTIGIQSLDDEILKKMNRPHTVKEAIEAIDITKKMGFKVNIEFIYGYPGQTIEAWIETVEKAVSLGADEIQLYRLKIIPYGDHMGSILKKSVKERKEYFGLKRAIMMKEIAILLLSQNGYNENLRRVFSKTQDDFSHYANNQCCNLFDEIGFGLTAFSSLRDRFGLNTQYFDKYYYLINQGKLPVDRGLVRNRDAQLRWALILPLKNREVNKKYYQRITGVSLDTIFRKKIEKLKEFNLLYENDKMLGLTPLGILFADEICHQFHHPDYMPFARTAYAQGKLNPYDDFQP